MSMNASIHAATQKQAQKALRQSSHAANTIAATKSRNVKPPAEQNDKTPMSSYSLQRPKSSNNHHVLKYIVKNPSAEKNNRRISGRDNNALLQPSLPSGNTFKES